ncbi:MAG: (2Fe-2S)-binding protein [Geothrix sp.]|uniref:2Fe-2S iron-sulfur cluster-binding protein n=1 Tax=Geothrix sp. TaxID=1962974 RepID=UPI001842807D|nr:2Fe-2S iron-sulfur cluster-binding protein [Geothrix sp.]NWJ41756.1 (2Fe-2S)-binding protein [Geothrix sp.]WIL20265.1 MAG: (2Fe-2S)-binding protein [Geothrix sp.]
MVKVHFRLEDLLVEAPAGTSLQRIADAASADITFGCRTGSCGTCRVRVMEGLSHCSEMGPEERDFLGGLNAPPDQRLACQVTVLGDVAIDYLGL